MQTFQAKNDLSLISKIMKQFESQKKLTIGENCNCGGDVRHNSGNRFHEIRSFLIRDNKYYFVCYTTRKGSNKYGVWKETTKEQIIKILTMWILEGYWYRFGIEFWISDRLQEDLDDPSRHHEEDYPNG